MGSRLEFHAILEGVLGSESVYFQPPPTVQMSYPCIVYQLSRIESRRANDELYSAQTAYDVTLIHEDPDTNLIREILTLPFSSFERHHAPDGLNHYVYRIYF
jgi:hypothetical protein